MSSIFGAIERNEIDKLRQILAKGADPNQTLDESGVTPLHFAAQYNRPEVAQLLIEAGAELEVRPEGDGDTALEIAEMYGHLKVMQIISFYLNRDRMSEN